MFSDISLPETTRKVCLMFLLISRVRRATLQIADLDLGQDEVKTGQDEVKTNVESKKCWS